MTTRCGGGRRRLQAAFAEFQTYLLPVLKDLGITASGPPMIMPIVDLVI